MAPQIEYDFGTNMPNALSDVEAVVNDTDLPEDSEKPRVFKAEFKDEVTNIVLSGPFSIQSLRSQAKIIKEDLLALGVDKIDIAPNPSEEILIEIPETELARLNLSMNDISRIISSSSVETKLHDAILSEILFIPRSFIDDEIKLQLAVYSGSIYPAE